ncbi:unnamed protein product, partial [Rotaria sp. Silwood1]
MTNVRRSYPSATMIGTRSEHDRVYAESGLLNAEEIAKACKFDLQGVRTP